MHVVSEVRANSFTVPPGAGGAQEEIPVRSACSQIAIMFSVGWQNPSTKRRTDIELVKDVRSGRIEILCLAAVAVRKLLPYPLI
jgi:hypothetical protein